MENPGVPLWEVFWVAALCHLVMDGSNFPPVFVHSSHKRNARISRVLGYELQEGHHNLRQAIDCTTRRLDLVPFEGSLYSLLLFCRVVRWCTIQCGLVMGEVVCMNLHSLCLVL